MHQDFGLLLRRLKGGEDERGEEQSHHGHSINRALSREV
jgi:hypothetical protein